MADESNLVLGVLKEILAELGGVRAEQRNTNVRLEGLERATVAELAAMQHQIGGLRGDVTELRDEQRQLTAVTAAGFRDLRSRFDHLLEFAGDRYRDHEERIRALEEKLPRK